MTTAVKTFNQKNAIIKSVKNDRLNTNLECHVINSNVTVDLANKTVTGQLLSYKSTNLLDSISNGSSPQPANGINFSFSISEESDLSLEDRVIAYVTENVNKIAAT